MEGRVTMQDIADALGLSRNTVSKAINNTGALAEATRERVLKKAIELGYKQFSGMKKSDFGSGEGTLPEKACFVEPEEAPAGKYLPKDDGELSSLSSAPAGMIAMFTAIPTGANHFPSAMLNKFQSGILQEGYEFVIYPVGKDEMKNLRLPRSFDWKNTAGIICFEIFDRPYCDMLCELGLPVLFVDAPASCCHSAPRADRLLMENRSSIQALVGEMVRRGKKKIGFIGETDRRQSFYERYLACLDAFIMFGVPHKKEWCITGHWNMEEPTSKGYQIYLMEKLGNLKKMPDVFLCANDYVALHVLRIFKELGISVPDDVYLCGFGNFPESTIIIPSLTTIRVYDDSLGSSAARLLLSRIQNPDLNYRTVYTETTPVYRESTREVKKL